MQSKKHKIICYICSLIIATIITIIVTIPSTDRNLSISYTLDEGHNWEIVEADVAASITDGSLDINSNQNGIYYVIVKDENNNQIKYQITFENNSMSVDVVE